jgi:uncharacterized protein DUF4395
MAAEIVRKVDQNGLKIGQALTIILLLLAFIIGATPVGTLLVAFVAVSQLLGAADSSVAPYRLIYQNLVKPSGLVKPNVITDNPEPHRFAMLLGGIFNTLATIALLAGGSVVAWALVWIVIVLANLNFWLNFCVGCLVYYQLNRLGVPGFVYAPLKK